MFLNCSFIGLSSLVICNEHKPQMLVFRSEKARFLFGITQVSSMRLKLRRISCVLSLAWQKAIPYAMYGFNIGWGTAGVMYLSPQLCDHGR